MKRAKIYIMTDSQATLKALEGNYLESLLVLECRDSPQKLGARNMVKLVWVPGHERIASKEVADELARKGATNSFTGPEPFCGLPRRVQAKRHIDISSKPRKA